MCINAFFSLSLPPSLTQYLIIFFFFLYIYTFLLLYVHVDLYFVYLEEPSRDTYQRYCKVGEFLREKKRKENSASLGPCAFNPIAAKCSV